MATDLFLEMAELPALPATGSLGTGQLDTRDLLVAGVPISISSKYLYLYLKLSGSTVFLWWRLQKIKQCNSATIEFFLIEFYRIHRICRIYRILSLVIFTFKITKTSYLQIP